MSSLLARLWIGLINSTLHWPLSRRRRLGHLLGDLLWWTVWPRRRVALANLRACFPQWSARERTACARACFRKVACSVLDYAVLWRGAREDLERLVRVEGAEHLQQALADRPVILLAPHFVGLDAGGLRVNTLARGVSIYARQSNRVWDDWLVKGRRRFNEPVLIARQGGDLRAVIRAMKDGLPFYYLPDMDLGERQSIFVPFFGVPAATIPMVSRLARMIDAKVVMAVTELTDDGYVLHFEAPWSGFPGASIEEDTARMNREIERWVLRMPVQYLWMHKRFKTRPPGAPGIY